MAYWILDGYNLLFRMQRLAGNLVLRRRRMLDLLSTRCSHQALCVVFDGRLETSEAERGHYGDLEVVYTSAEQTADLWILQFLEETHTPSRYVVISDDRELRERARARGAQGQRTDFLLQRLQSSHQGDAPARSLPLPASRYCSLFEERWDRLQRGESIEGDGES